MATVRELVTKWGFRVDDRPLRRMDARIAGLKASMVSLASISTRVGVGFAAMSAGIGFLLKEAGDFEQIEIAFETLTQSQEKAKKLTADLISFAQKTPFELKGVFTASKQLLAYGIEAENMIDTLTALGNISAGVGREKLPQLTLAFGQVRTAGRLRGQEVRQFTEAGVPIIEAIAKEMGVANSAVQDLVSKGQVSFEITNRALQNLANGTGRFTGLMEKQSSTLLGMLSNLKDAFQVLAITVGGTLLPEAKEYVKTALEWVEANKKLVQSKVVRFVSIIVKSMKKLFKLGMGVYRVFKALITILGGFENAVRMATVALTAMVGVRVLGFLGSFGLLALSASKNLALFVLRARSAAIALFALNTVAMAIPLLIGGALAALFLLVEDLIVYFQGGDSLIGALVENFDKAAPGFLKALDKFEEVAVTKVKAVMDKIVSFLTGDEFAGQRDTIAKALLAALDVAIVGSAALAKIGFTIGQIIVDGMVEAMATRFPTLFGALGIDSKKSRKSNFDFMKKQGNIEGARRSIAKHGVDATRSSGAFSDEELQRAQDRQRRLTVTPDDIDKIKNSKEALKVLMNNPALARAMHDKEITISEMLSDSSIAPALNKMRGIIGGNTAPTNFTTTVNVNGTNLAADELEQAITTGVSNAQMQTVKDLQNQSQSAIAE